MKKNGSALVFSILILSFFLAISLNIFFLARKKSERAGVKVSGERITNNIDIASSLGYQELQLAEKFVREGVLYDSSHPNRNDSYTLPSTGSYLYIDPATGDFSNRYAGIQINNFIDYFSSHWNPGPTSSKNQKLIIGEEISSGKVISRMWQSAGIDSILSPLWQLRLDDPTDNSLSIGGYSLESVPDFDTDLDTGTAGLQAAAVYTKFISLSEREINSITVPESIFKIEITEKFDYVDDGSNISISNRQISSFIIEALN